MEQLNERAGFLFSVAFSVKFWLGQLAFGQILLESTNGESRSAGCDSQSITSPYSCSDKGAQRASGVWASAQADESGKSGDCDDTVVAEA